MRFEIHSFLCSLLPCESLLTEEVNSSWLKKLAPYGRTMEAMRTYVVLGAMTVEIL